MRCMYSCKEAMRASTLNWQNQNRMHNIYCSHTQLRRGLLRVVGSARCVDTERIYNIKSRRAESTVIIIYLHSVFEIFYNKLFVMVAFLPRPYGLHWICHIKSTNGKWKLLRTISLKIQKWHPPPHTATLSTPRNLWMPPYL